MIQVYSLAVPSFLIIHLLPSTTQLCRFISGIAAMGYSPPTRWLGSVLDEVQGSGTDKLLQVATKDPEVYWQ